ncbi:MAG: MBL fold metallo-hydrolase [Dehalococcoidia bacterium]|nr:MBL fold metallo-hydrolase [Dehalococcoidia bacterium]
MFGGVQGNLMGDMAAKGVEPDGIDTVVHTHLHFDHISWNAAEDRSPPGFKNARYVANQARTGSSSSSPDVQANFPPNSFEGPMRPLEKAGVLDLVQGEHTLTDELTLIPTPGHTPGHMSVLVASAGEKAIITGDVFINPAQVTNTHWSAAFDADPATATATRNSVLDRIEAEGLRPIVCHFPSPGLGGIVRVDGTRYWHGRRGGGAVSGRRRPCGARGSQVPGRP